MNVDIHKLSQLIIDIARQEILPRFERHAHSITSMEKSDGSVVTETDVAVQEKMMRVLRQQYPSFEFLGEEMDASQQKSLLADAKGPVWCLDPLDGTSNYASGVPFFAVSLALLENGHTRLGIIYDPTRNECFYAKKGVGAFLNGQALKLKHQGQTLSQCLANVDFKRLSPESAGRISSENVYRSQRNFGSCALEFCWLACRRIQLYLHGGMKLWDYAAGHLILQEAGGSACSLDGSPVPVTEVVPRSVVAAVESDLFRDWCRYLNVPHG